MENETKKQAENTNNSNEKLLLSDVSCSSFDNTKIELVHQIRKQQNWGFCDIKVALLKSNYNVEDAIKLLSINKYRVA
jgi:hypothetical protein